MSMLDARLEIIHAIDASRVGYSLEEDAAHGLIAAWMEAAGLEVTVDEAKNTIGRRGDAKVWIGSHLDSVPNGGKYDGVLGVLAGIEIAERTDLPLVVVAFRDEERGCVGSEAAVATGDLPQAYFELHIEQGPILDNLDPPFGIVTAIVGQARGEVVFHGRAGHAGTTPMAHRQDALVEAAAFVQRVAAAPKGDAVATVGSFVVEPGGSNVIPERVTLTVDARATTPEALDELVATIGFEPTWRTQPVPMSGAQLESLRAVAPGAPELVSGAGHDAASLAAAGVPSAMLFVRSRNGGISHHPDEYSSEEDIEAALEVLIDAVARIS